MIEENMRLNKRELTEAIKTEVRRQYKGKLSTIPKGGLT